MIRYLDEDEKGKHILPTPGWHRPGVRLQGAGNLRQFDMSSVIFPC